MGVTENQIAIAKNVLLYDVLIDSGISLSFGPDVVQQFRCPLHGDGKDLSGRGSARFYPDMNGAKCWGCSVWYDPIGWIRRFHGMEFPEAVIYLCQEYADESVLDSVGKQKHIIEGKLVLNILEQDVRNLFTFMSFSQKIGISQVLDELWHVGCTRDNQRKIEKFLEKVKDNVGNPK